MNLENIIKRILRTSFLAGALAVSPYLSGCASAHSNKSPYDSHVPSHKYKLIQPDKIDIKNLLKYNRHYPCATMELLFREEFQKRLKSGTLFQKETLERCCENGIYGISTYGLRKIIYCPLHNPRQSPDEEKVESILENVPKKPKKF